MNLRNVLSCTRWSDVAQALRTYYDLEDLINYERVYYELHILAPEDSSGFQIEINAFEEDDDTERKIDNCEVFGKSDHEYYFTVSGLKNGESYSIDLLSWEEWLAMIVSPETLKQYLPEEVVAHCLWEMTFCGYTQEEIRSFFAKIQRIYEEETDAPNN